jgi:hypothetical protein
MELEHELFGKPGDPFEGHHRYQRVKPALVLLGCGRSKLYQLIRTGRIRAVKIDHMTYVDLASVARLFSKCPEIVPVKHQHEISEAALGFPEPEPMPFLTITEADLISSRPPGGAVEPVDESGSRPGGSFAPAPTSA